MQTKCSVCSKEYNVSDDILWKKAKCSCWETFVVERFDFQEQEWEKIIETALNSNQDVQRKNIQKEENIDIKPHFASYMFLWSPALIFLIILIILASIWASFAAWLVWMLAFSLPVIFWVLLLLWFGWRLVKYKKEKYTLTDRKIVYHFWNLFSDNATEIALDRVVQVKTTLWFIQNLIFKTGNIEIKTAWSSDSTVTFRNISVPMNLYEKLRERMRKNGFHLAMDKLVQEERPHWLGIVWEVFGKALMWIVFLAYVLFWIYEESMQNDDMGLEEIWNEIWAISDGAVAGWIGFWTVILIIIWIVFVLKYLDLKQRRYQIFTDTIVYREWFLTKHHSFIPMENISDTENSQSFFSKIFGLHDVVVSSAWNNNKVSFKNMVNWEKMMENIKYLKNETILNEKDILEGEDENPDSLIGFKNKTEMALNFDKWFQAKYQSNIVRSLFWLLFTWIIILLVSFFIWIISWDASIATYIFSSFIPVALVVSVMTIIRIKFTHFTVWESSIEKKFGFISTKHNSFSVEKITWVVFKESLIDKLFKTCSITFWSIWNGADITFKNIKKSSDLEKNIKAKLGINSTELVKEITSQLTFWDYIKSKIWVFIIFSIIYITSLVIWYFASIEFWNMWEVLWYISGWFGLIIFLIILRFLYSKFYYSSTRYINKIYTDSIESIQWFFIVHKKYSLFRNVKWTKAKKYPLTATWDLTFNIAWEQVHVNEKQKGNGLILILSLLGKKWGGWATTIVSNKISMKFIKDIFNVFESTESILNEEVVETESILTSKQDIWNSIASSVIIYVLVIVGLWFFWASEIGMFIFSIIAIITTVFGIIIGLTIWMIKVKFYDYQKDRVLFKSWIIYKQLHSILYKKFNYVEFNKGFINKIFKNGNIKIYTLGSGSIDMSIKDIDNYKEVYELFKKD